MMGENNENPSNANKTNENMEGEGENIATNKEDNYTNMGNTAEVNHTENKEIEPSDNNNNEEMEKKEMEKEAVESNNNNMDSNAENKMSDNGM